MRSLTTEQAAAVQRRRGSLLLAAGAGSGKTSVLVERFVAAVREDGIAPGRILAITFTDRAAAELRQRARARLLELGDRDAARETEGAQIGTVHAFCARLLRAHALALGLDPRFGVLDEARAGRLRSAAFSSALAMLVGGQGDGDDGDDARRVAAIDVVAAYGAERLQTTIVAVHEELRSRGERVPSIPPPASPPPLAPLAATLAAAARGARHELADVGDPGRRVADALDALDRVEGVLATAGDTVALPAALRAIELPGANGTLAGPGCAAYRTAQADFAQLCADRQAIGVVAALQALLDEYATAYAERKRERGQLDFDDLELGARDLLEGSPRVRDAWAARFELLMVDEFQDTNPRQLAILRALDRDNLFTVGDEFQSIYGFRHADVSLFRARRRALAAAGGDAGSGATLALAGNFRSAAPLLDVVNAVFAPRFGPDFTPLVPGRDGLSPTAGESAATEPLVELLLTDTRGWEEAAVDVGLGLPPTTSWRAAEARLLAQRLAELVAGEHVRPGEIAVLVRASGDIPVYERAIEEVGLPTLAAGAGGYWSHQQVADLLAYLSALANPLDEKALYGTLASPIAGVSADALALLGEHRGEDGPWAALDRAFPDPGDGDGPLLEALGADDRGVLRSFCPWLRAERRAIPGRPLAELIERVLAHSGYARHVLGLRWGERRMANVHKLLRLARDFEAQEGRDLRAFLDHAARQVQAQAREAEAPIEDAELDAVRLMTIHAAKGLEFGVVAVADLGRQGRTDVPDLLVGPRAAEGRARVGLRLVTLDGSAPVAALDHAALRDELLQAQEQEEQRILYVAMTRARERLLCSGAVNPERWPPQRPGGPPISWLGPALAEDLSQLDGREPIRELHPPGAPGARVLCRLSSPATLGRVLRAEPPAPTAPADGGEGDGAGAAFASRVIPSAGEDATSGSPESPRGPSVHPGAIERISYTALAAYERCGYRYYAERVLGLAPDEREVAPAAAGPAEGRLQGRLRGSIVHRLLQTADLGSGRAPTARDVERVAEELGGAPVAHEAEQIAALVGAVAGTELGARLARAARVQREHAFSFSLAPDAPLFTGVVDVIAHELDGGCLIVDYKSDRVGTNDLAELTGREYGVQRLVYALAALLGGSLRVDVVHWFLERPDAPVSAEFVAADSDGLVAELRTRVAGLLAGSFPVSPRPHLELCAGCPARRGLCSHDDSLTGRPLADLPDAPLV